jgi:hypothetical protein
MLRADAKEVAVTGTQPWLDGFHGAILMLDGVLGWFLRINLAGSHSAETPAGAGRGMRLAS